mmetsp:Transcript_29047/g.44684  ORF Transcript_29047/g.44684 Transcript_29047/m.44684 type:complete len:272 (+) Transcript_29047:799-1614(+)
MLQISTTSLKKSFLFKGFFVFCVKDLLHGCPESFLPLEDSFLGHNVWSDFSFQTSLKKQMSKLSNIVVGIVVDDHHIVVVSQITLVDDKRRRSVFRQVCGQKSSLPNFVPARSIFAPNSVAFEEHGALVTKFNPLDVDSVSGNCDTIPSSSHSTIGRSKGFRQAKFLDLIRRRRDGGLFKNSPNSLSSLYRFVKNFIIRVITSITREIVVFPGRSVKVRLNPLVNNEVASIMGHFFAGDVDHGRGLDALANGNFGIHITRRAQEATVWSQM